MAEHGPYGEEIREITRRKTTIFNALSIFETMCFWHYKHHLTRSA